MDNRTEVTKTDGSPKGSRKCNNSETTEESVFLRAKLKKCIQMNQQLLKRLIAGQVESKRAMSEYMHLKKEMEMEKRKKSELKEFYDIRIQKINSDRIKIMKSVKKHIVKLLKTERSKFEKERREFQTEIQQLKERTQHELGKSIVGLKTDHTSEIDLLKKRLEVERRNEVEKLSRSVQRKKTKKKKKNKFKKHNIGLKTKKNDLKLRDLRTENFRLAGLVNEIEQHRIEKRNFQKTFEEQHTKHEKEKRLMIDEFKRLKRKHDQKTLQKINKMTREMSKMKKENSQLRSCSDVKSKLAKVLRKENEELKKRRVSQQEFLEHATSSVQSMYEKQFQHHRNENEMLKKRLDVQKQNFNSCLEKSQDQVRKEFEETFKQLHVKNMKENNKLREENELLKSENSKLLSTANLRRKRGEELFPDDVGSPVLVVGDGLLSSSVFCRNNGKYKYATGRFRTLSLEQMKKLDERAKAVGCADKTSVEEVVFALFGDYDHNDDENEISKEVGDETKARMIFSWIVHHIFYYNHAELGLETPEQILSRSPKYTVCRGYSALFKAMCDRVHLECEEVKGQLKGLTDRKIARFFINNGHAWNIVKIGQRWMFVDTSSAAGLCWEGAVGNVSGLPKKKDHCFKELDDHFFLADPKEMIYTHFSEPSEKHQFLERPISFVSWQKSMSIPHIAFARGLKNLKERSNHVQLSNTRYWTLSFDIHSDAHVEVGVTEESKPKISMCVPFNRIVWKERKEIKTSQVLSRRRRDRMTIHFCFPEPKEYVVYVLVNQKPTPPTRKEDYCAIMKYWIDVQKSDNIMQNEPKFWCPEILPDAIQRNARFLEGWNMNMAKSKNGNKHYMKIECNGVDRIALLVIPVQENPEENRLTLPNLKKDEVMFFQNCSRGENYELMNVFELEVEIKEEWSVIAVAGMKDKEALLQTKFDQLFVFSRLSCAEMKKNFLFR